MKDDSGVIATAPAPFTLDQADAERLTKGTWIGADRSVTFRGATIDSRAVKKGMMFCCCVGASHDGHDFAEKAAAAGAVFFVATRLVNVDVPVLLVEDIPTALGQLAHEFRQRHHGAVWIGITGSNGKTTTKELIAAACGAPSPTVHATRGNLNNHLGVPLTILSTPESATHVIIEMGANHPGEIAALAAITRPDIGVICSIGPAHLEGFGDVMGVARAKGELFAALSSQSQAICGVHGLANMCASFTIEPEAILDILRGRAKDKRLALIGSAQDPVRGEVRSEGVVLHTDAGHIQLAVLGQHNLGNATVAYRAALAAGIEPTSALAGMGRVAPVSGRLATIAWGKHHIIDDSYNANPSSMLAALQVLSGYQGQRLAVLGAMGEMGSAHQQGHQQVGIEAARLGLPLVVVGAKAHDIVTAYRSVGGIDVEHVDDHHAAVLAVNRRVAHEPTTVLVKASRSAGLDVVVTTLTARVMSA